MSVCPAHTKGILANSPDLLKSGLFVDGAINDSERTLLSGEWFSVRGVTAPLFARGAGTFAPKQFR